VVWDVRVPPARVLAAAMPTSAQRTRTLASAALVAIAPVDGGRGE
jgi:hypothetical protein